MRIQKLLTMICVAALLGGITLKAQRSDSDSQAKAREATRQTVDHLNEIGAPTTPPYYISKEPGAEDDMPKTTSSEPSKPGKWLNPEDEYKARKAVRGTIAEKNAKEGKVDPEKQVWPKRLPKEEQAHAEMALHKAEAEQTAVVQSHPHPMPVMTPQPTPQPTPTPTPGPGTKEARLAELLRLYKADKITPAEYHEQRAKIVAEP